MRNFAKIFETEQFGQILVVATTNEDGFPCLAVTADTHPDFLSPTAIEFSFNEEEDVYERLEEIEHDQVLLFGKAIKEQVDKFTFTAEEED